ncbi:hypothetical protein Tco_0221835 [Tanacetum coccineum]
MSCQCLAGADLQLREGRQVECLGGETDIVPLSYHIVDDFEIEFRREEFCLVTGLKFGVDYSVDYKNEDDPIPFRRQENVDDNKAYSMFGFTWAFKILESFRVGAHEYYRRQRRYPRVVAWSAKRKFFRNMLKGFFHGRLPAARLTSDENEVVSNWWVLSRAYFDGCISEAARIPRHVNRQNLSDFPSEFYREFEEQKKGRGFPHAGPSSLPTQANNSFFEGAQATPSYGHNMATPNWQTPMPSHPGLPMKRGDKTKNKGKNANVSPLNLGNAFADDNVGEDDVMIMDERETGNYFVYENVDASKVRREDYIDCTEFMLNPYDVYLHLTAWNEPTKRVGCPRTMRTSGNESVLDTDGSTHNWNIGWFNAFIPALNDVDWVYMPINVVGNHWVTGGVNLLNSLFMCLTLCIAREQGDAVVVGLPHEVLQLPKQST